MSDLGAIPTPALVLDLDRAEQNIRRMAARAERDGVALRPHVKTHKCVELGLLQRHFGGDLITVSTLDEARIYAASGFPDITWAFPVIPSRIPECVALHEQTRLRLVADSLVTVRALEQTGVPFEVLLKVDCGYHRAGVDPQGEEAVRVAQSIANSPTLRLAGLLSHSGHSYRCRSAEEAREVGAEEGRIVVDLAEKLRAGGLEVATVSVGSTPACSVGEAVPGVTEIRPGNYVFFDRSQVAFGSCEVVDTAVSVLSTVVSSRTDLDHSIVDAGALALSKDAGPSWVEPSSFGEAFSDYAAGTLSGRTRIESLTQEHGILSRALPVGTRLRILPNHSCLTVACFDEYHVVRGTELIDRWKIHRRRS